MPHISTGKDGNVYQFSCTFSSKIPEYSHLIATDNTKHSGLTDADNDNKRLLLHDQDGQTWFRFLWIARIVQLAIANKDAALDLSKYHYPFN